MTASGRKMATRLSRCCSKVMDTSRTAAFGKWHNTQDFELQMPMVYSKPKSMAASSTYQNRGLSGMGFRVESRTNGPLRCSRTRRLLSRRMTTRSGISPKPWPRRQSAGSDSRRQPRQRSRSSSTSPQEPVTAPTTCPKSGLTSIAGNSIRAGTASARSRWKNRRNSGSFLKKQS